MKRRLRIFVAHPSEMLTDHVPHGDGLVAFSYLSRLAARGHELHVAAQGVELRDPVPASLHIHPLSRSDATSPLQRLVFMTRMRRLFQRLQLEAPFDVIHQMNPVFTGLSLALAGTETPLVLGAFVPRWQTTDDPARLSMRARLVERAEHVVARIQQARAAALVVASAGARSRIHDAERHRDHIFEVPHGIDLSRFPVRPAPPSRPSVLFLSSVQYRKGIFTLLDAFARVAPAVPGVELVVAGLGPDLAEVRRRAERMEGCTIRFTGRVAREQVGDVMRDHSVYCLPSIGEPFGMTVLEAMACGLPVVATRAGGIPDLVSSEGGRLVPPRDADALAAALVEVLQSRQRQCEMGTYNRARVERLFDIEKTVDRLEATYEAILSKANGVRNELATGAQEEAC
jgi:glycosyltransferase involved in cell wall biosynthesis